MNVQKVTDKSFRKYGRVLEGYSLSDLLEAMKHTPLPDEVIYVPSDSGGAGIQKPGIWRPSDTDWVLQWEE